MCIRHFTTCPNQASPTLRQNLIISLVDNKHSKADKPTENRRNGKSEKTIASKHGELRVAVPRDRAGEFEPKIIKKNQRRFDGFDDLILSLYSRGLSTREIQAHIEEIYGVEVSPDLVVKPQISRCH